MILQPGNFFWGLGADGAILVGRGAVRYVDDLGNIMKIPFIKSILWSGRLCVFSLLLSVVGCATKAPKQYLVFPTPPEEPRIQFLTGISSEADLAPQGGFAHFILGEQRIHRPIMKPYGIASQKDFLYVCNTELANFSVIDLAKKTLRYFIPQGMGAIKLPINIAVAPDGTRYVTDLKRQQVLVYAKDGAYNGTFGKTNMIPCGLALAGDRLYVTDMHRDNPCVRVYSLSTGEELFTAPNDPANAKDEEGRLYHPTNVALDPEGNIYVSDTGNYCVQIYDAQGKHLRKVGDQAPLAGHFLRNKGIGVDREGRFYVVDSDTGVAQLFDREGHLLLFFGVPKASGDASLYLPAGVCVDYENVGYFQKFAAPGVKIEYLIFITNQAGPNKIGVYGFIKK